MRVLFANHTANLSGAEYSMLRLAMELRTTDEVAVACPNNGPLAGRLRRCGIPQFSIPPVSASFRLGPVRTPLGAVRVVSQGLALQSVARRSGADVLHANTVRAGLSAAVAARLGCCPVVVRIHDTLPRSPLGLAVRRAIASTADQRVAVSDRTAEIFDWGLGGRQTLTLRPSIDLDLFDPARVDAADIRGELSLPAESALLGEIAQLTSWKGQDVAIRALHDVRAAGIDAHLVLIGDVSFDSARYDNRAYVDELHRLTDRLGLDDSVHFLGQRNDVAALMKALDVTLLPSEDEPFGTAVAESMAVGTPAIVAAPSGCAEFVRDGEDGRVLFSREPQVWARAIVELLRDQARLATMRQATKEPVLLLSEAAHAREVSAIHHRAVCRSTQPLEEVTFGS
jgi:glycosyltransferase involved in cell wall biosynthesis